MYLEIARYTITNKLFHFRLVDGDTPYVYHGAEDSKNLNVTKTRSFFRECIDYYKGGIHKASHLKLFSILGQYLG